MSLLGSELEQCLSGGLPEIFSFSASLVGEEEVQQKKRGSKHYSFSLEGASSTVKYSNKIVDC